VIASLTGEVQTSSNGLLVIDVAGVGYLVHTSSKTSASISRGDQLTVFTSLVVREDAFTLFGFLDPAELEVFELLRSVNGVGPKSALAILGELSVEQISNAVASESDATFKAVSGIGAKTAKLITLTLAGKLSANPASGGSAPVSEETVSALVGLGWSEKQSREALVRSSKPGMSSEELLKAALKSLAISRKA
jgi:holliday junction DNA helicase RuvA